MYCYISVKRGYMILDSITNFNTNIINVSCNVYVTYHEDIDFHLLVHNLTRI